MEEYYFLFGLGLVWIVFATIQDLRKREVANWLNFSLISFGISFKLFYSLWTGNWDIVFFGVLGLVSFILLGYAFYYGRVFAGGDAKLLMGIGAILPYRNYFDLLYLSGGFLVLLFLAGAVYTLIYSGFIAVGNKKRYVKELKKNIFEGKWLFLISVLLILFIESITRSIVVLLGFVFLLMLYFHVKAVDACMIKLYGSQDLCEGDWLAMDVKLKKGFVRRSVHGLSLKEIDKIRKEGKRVWIKEGIPFVPAFLIAFLVREYVLTVLQLDLMTAILSLLR